MARPIIGLDIGHSCIKGVKVAPLRKGAELISYSSLNFHGEVVERGKVVDEAVLANALGELAKDLRPGRARIVAAVSGEQAVIRTIKVPAMAEKELRDALPWAMEEHLPFPVEEASMDFVIREKDGPGVDKDKELLDILVVAVPTEVVESYLRPMRRVGINPCCLDLQPYALVHNYLYFNPQNKENLAIVDIGASTTDIVIVKEDDVELTRTVSLGGNDFTKAISHAFNITRPEAEQFKLRQSGSDGSRLEDCLISLAEEIGAEISRSMEYFHIQRRGETIDKILLTGGSAYTAGLKKYLTENLNAGLEWWEFSSMLQISPRISADDRELECFSMVGLGLALSEVLV